MLTCGLFLCSSLLRLAGLGLNRGLLFSCLGFRCWLLGGRLGLLGALLQLISQLVASLHLYQLACLL